MNIIGFKYCLYAQDWHFWVETRDMSFYRITCEEKPSDENNKMMSCLQGLGPWTHQVRV